MFWQFIIRTLSELDIVSNQNLSIEMLLMRLIYIDSSNPRKNQEKQINISEIIDEKNVIPEFKKEPVDQIRNITQEKKLNLMLI